MKKRGKSNLYVVAPFTLIHHEVEYEIAKVHMEEITIPAIKERNSDTLSAA